MYKFDIYLSLIYIFVMPIIETTPYSLQQGFKRHRHSGEYELYLFYLGRGTFQTGNECISFSGPTLFLVPPRTPHRLQVAPDCRLVRIYGTRFTWPTGTSELRKKARTLLGGGHPVDGTACLSVFDGIRKRLSTGDPFLIRSAESWLTSFLYDTCAAGKVSPAASGNRHVAEAIRILRNCVYEEITADELALQVGIHKAYLIRLFKKHTGTTPMRYLIDFRIEGSEWQLKHTDKPVHRIAREFLFYDEFHFSRVFKERKGMPPRQYRETVRKT